MAGEAVITVIGNLTADPELRFTPSGAAVANFTVASTPRIYDRNTSEDRIRRTENACGPAAGCWPNLDRSS